MKRRGAGGRSGDGDHRSRRCVLGRPNPYQVPPTVAGP
jgi:hypothetical protein